MAIRLSRCCCFTARTGAIIVAVLGIFSSTLAVGLYSFSLAEESYFEEILDKAEQQLQDAYDSQSMSGDQRQRVEFAMHVLDVVKDVFPKFLIAMVVLACIYFVKNLMLMLGVVYNKSCLMLPWLLIILFTLIIQTVGLVAYAVLMGIYTPGGFISSLMIVGIGGPLLAIYYYIWFVVLSVYNEIREGKPQKFDRLPILTEEVVPPPYTRDAEKAC